MGLRINNNIEAFNAHRNLIRNSSGIARSMARLSSGLRINSAADDAAGLGISERMRGQIRGLAMAQRNAQDGISLVQAAEGSMQEMHSIIHRIRELAVQFNNTLYGTADKQAIAGEVAQLSAELDRMIAQSDFNGIQLLNNTANITLQIGANTGEEVVISTIDLSGAGAFGSTEIATFAGLAATATPGSTVNIDNIHAALDVVATNRSTFGAVQNRLEFTINSLGIAQENMQAAESRIRDVDMAWEMTQLTRMQIIQQSSIAMLGQANIQPQSLLSLLQ